VSKIEHERQEFFGYLAIPLPSPTLMRMFYYENTKYKSLFFKYVNLFFWTSFQPLGMGQVKLMSFFIRWTKITKNDKKLKKFFRCLDTV
jgi:hypothetical protein